MIKRLSLILLISGIICFGAQRVYAASMGEEVVFNVDSLYDSIEREELTATLHVVGSHVYFYIDNAYWRNLSSVERTVFIMNLENLSDEFDRVIYPKERAVFGSEWSPGIDGDKKITVLISQLIDDAAGYFNTYDEYPKDQIPSSNEREMIYLNAIVVENEMAGAFLAHEFQHLITFYQKTKLYNLEEDVWLNEARSEYSATVCGYNNNYINSYLADRVDLFLDSPSDSLTEWKNSSSDYGVVSLFFHYLVNHYGKDIITKMVLNNKIGIESINQALLDLGYTDTFSDIFANWSISNYINDCDINSDDKYCYKDKDLTYDRLHVDYSSSYSGFPNLIVSRSSAVKDWSPRWYRFRQVEVVSTDKDTLKLEFRGIGQEADFRVSYIITDEDNQTTVQFMSLNNQKGAVYIPNFTSLNKSVVIVPFNQYKKSDFGDNENAVSFTFTASSVDEGSISINSIVPSVGPSAGGFEAVINGSGLSSAVKINFGKSIITNFNIVDDKTINFIVPSQEQGKINISVIDDKNNEVFLVNGFSYIKSYVEGSLIRAKGDYKVYIIKGSYKRWIQHQDIFNMYGHLNWEDIIDVEPEELEYYQNAWLIRSDKDEHVYEVNTDGTKHWLNMTAEEFNISGRRWNMVYIVNNFERDFYKTSSDILFQ
ncbi:IPT/TIG domain-containing protein [Patescibacteria group bacterium]